MTAMPEIPARKALGVPFLVSADGVSHRLAPVALAQTGQYNEAWLQALLHAHPEILPIPQIEPGFGTPVPAAREVACGHGYIDNLFLTPAGDIVLVETKLWRNAEARREVLAQALDYVSALMTMDYARFEAAAIKAGMDAKSLYELVADQPEAVPEPEFFDAVSRNLRRGRMLVLAVGDGIRQEAERLAALIQHQMMAQFTFALVEIRLCRHAATDAIIAVPSTLAQTVMIERGVLRLSEGAATIQQVLPGKPPAAAAKSITEEMFYETIAGKSPDLPGHIRAFLAAAAGLGVYPDFQASLNLKVDIPDAPRPLNIGYIQKNGQLRTNPVSWHAGDELALGYAQRLADLVGGEVATHDGIYASSNGKSPVPVTSLLPQHQAGWLTAIGELIEGYRAQLQEQG